jgi:CDP-6-deoxy-D-xylo-4-hexulose-3-dehydrase
MQITKGTTAAWFGFPILCESMSMRDKLRKHLEKNNIETRPIICGNIVKQPAVKNIKHRIYGKLEGADEIMDKGIFWGSSPDMSVSEINYVIKVIKDFFK